MLEIHARAAVFAQGQNFDKFRQMGSELRRRTTESSGDDLVLLVIVAALVPLFVVALYVLVKVQEKRENLKSPKALFRELCRAHALDRGAKHLLAQLAAHHELTDPARLFLEPERFDVTRLGGVWRDKATQLDQLRARLFARDRAPLAEAPGAKPLSVRQTAPTATPCETAAAAKKPITFPQLSTGATKLPTAGRF